MQSLASAVLQATSLQEQCKAYNLSPQPFCRRQVYKNIAKRTTSRLNCCDETRDPFITPKRWRCSKYNESTRNHCIECSRSDTEDIPLSTAWSAIARCSPVRYMTTIGHGSRRCRYCHRYCHDTVAGKQHDIRYQHRWNVHSRTWRQADAIHAHALQKSMDIAPIPTALLGSGAAYQVAAIPSAVCLALYRTQRISDDNNHIWGKIHPHIG